MKSKKNDKLIIKFISQSITKSELDQLSDWLEQPENEQIFKDYIKVNYALDYNMANFNAETAKHTVLKIIDADNIKPRRIRTLKYYRYAAAAVIAILLSSAVFFFRNAPTSNPESITNVSPAILPGTNKAILTLDNGERITLEKGEKVNTDQMSSDGENLLYKQGHETDKKTTFNYLTVPRRGQFFVQLSDGTKVWLNSESKLKYPVTFVKGKTRLVELIYGEAYFDVSHSINHNGSGFKVNTKVQDVEVLGTEFNIKAYNGEGKIFTTLVHGRIEISNGINKKVLNSGFQSVVAVDKDDVTVSKVNVTDEIAWKNGFFRFREKTLGEILIVLARWYDATLIYKNEERKHIVFSGVLKRSDSIEELLNKIQKTGAVRFKIEDNKIIVI